MIISRDPTATSLSRTNFAVRSVPTLEILMDVPATGGRGGNGGDGDGSDVTQGGVCDTNVTPS